ncbi:nucleotide-binding protein [Cupriavidus basilensis]
MRCREDQVKYLTQKHGLPAGRKIEGSRRRNTHWTRQSTGLHESETSPDVGRQAQRSGSRLQLQRGVAKTSTTVAMNRRATLRGLKVLVIDCDGQVPATTDWYQPEQDVDVRANTYALHPR